MTTMLTPFVDGDAIDLGRTWRKQILKFGKIRTNTGAVLDINEDLANECLQAFNDAAYDQVPLVLVDGKNQHPDADKDGVWHPEQYRGSIKALEITADGMDMLMEPSPKGAELLKENPHLGVSARIVPNYSRSDGKTWRAAIEHVAGTLNPVVTGMRPWEAVNLSTSDDGDVIDFSTEATAMADDQPNDDKKTEPAETEQQGSPIAARLSDEDIARIAELVNIKVQLDADDDTDDEDEEKSEAELVGAGADLSADVQAAIDLAQANAEEANTRSAVLEQQLANERADREAANYLNAGVPPAAVNLARPALSVAADVIDLSNGQSTDTGQIIRGLLDFAKGTIDLSKEKGHGDITAEDKQRTEALQAAWDNDFPESARIVNKK